MSVINNALSELADKDNTKASPLARAEIPAVPHSSRLAWAVGGFTLSLCFGGWAVSWQEEDIQPEIKPVVLTVEQLKPLNKEKPVTLSDSKSAASLTEGAGSSAKKVVKEATTQKPITKETVTKETVTKDTTTKKTTTKETTNRLGKSLASQSKVKNSAKQDKPLLLAQAQTAAPAKATSQNKAGSKSTVTESVETKSVETEPVEKGSMVVHQVELTPEQLEQKAIQRAKKALDANNLSEAIEAYERALKYQPGNETSRKKLAALYYGKNDSRSAAEVLQRGIKRDKESQALRLTLSRLLIKENQPEAALSPLVYLPENPQVDYLAMRAALAQQNKMADIALETYQMLVNREDENARWWLGLAIQQERKMMYPEAKSSYQKALGRIGVSKKTQTFIRDRISLLESLEEKPNAN